MGIVEVEYAKVLSIATALIGSIIVPVEIVVGRHGEGHDSGGSGNCPLGNAFDTVVRLLALPRVAFMSHCNTSKQLKLSYSIVKEP